MDNTLYKFYTENADFKNYVDKCIKTYGKDLDAVFELSITKEYYQSLQKGNCNSNSENVENEQT